jgi:integrase
MIYRQNWKDAEKYLEYLHDVEQLEELSVVTRRTQLRYLLLWADDVPLGKAPSIVPVFPRWLANYRQAPQGWAQGPLKNPLSYNSQQAAISAVRGFFRWARSRHPRRYSQISDMYLKTLKPIKQKGRPNEREAYTLEQVQALINLPVRTLKDRRKRSTVALLFLSGMRIGACTTLPIKALDLEKKSVKQWPEWGVRTKFSKAATTFLLELPELLEVVADWDSYVRSRLPEDALWYSRLDYRGRELVPTYGNGLRMRGRFRKSLKAMCEWAGIPYMSPHKLRHGHVEYALGQAKTVDQLKAISLNVMHGNLSTTDGIYGIFHERDVEARIRALGSSEGEGLNGLGATDQAAVIEQHTEILHKLRNGGGGG